VRAPLANHGGREVPPEPPVVTLDAKDLARQRVVLDRATPVTLVVNGGSYGVVFVDGKAVGAPPLRLVVAAGHHQILLQIEDY